MAMPTPECGPRDTEGAVATVTTGQGRPSSAVGREHGPPTPTSSILETEETQLMSQSPKQGYPPGGKVKRMAELG